MRFLLLLIAFTAMSSNASAEKSHEEKLNEQITQQAYKVLRAARMCAPGMGSAWYRFQRSRVELQLLQAGWSGPASVTSRWERSIDREKQINVPRSICDETVEDFARDLQVTIDTEEARAAEWCRTRGC